MKSNNSDSYNNIVLLRGIASFLVVYDHLFAQAGIIWFGKVFFPTDIIRKYITVPAGIIQDFGWFGVVLFFLISGFLITHVSLRESQLEFIIRRIFRIYPPLIVAILIAILATWVQGGQLFKLSEYLISFTLFNYWIPPQKIPLGVAWTLIIEILFYLMIFLVVPILKKKPWAAILVEFTLVTVVLATCRIFGTAYFLFSASFSYLPYLIAGQLIYLLHARKISFNTFGLYTLINYILIYSEIRSLYPQFLTAENSYLISFLYAYVVFFITLLLRGHIFPSRLNRFASDSSYSIYLYHGTIGFLLIDRISRITKNGFVIIPVVVLCYLAAYLSYRFVEIPSIRFGKKLSTKIAGWKFPRTKKTISTI